MDDDDSLTRILTDLIFELRAAHDLRCDGCGDGYPCSIGDAYISAEERLREVSEIVSGPATVAPCRECNTETTVTCADCERSYRVYESEIRAFYRFHQCPIRTVMS